VLVLFYLGTDEVVMWLEMMGWDGMGLECCAVLCCAGSGASSGRTDHRSRGFEGSFKCLQTQRETVELHQDESSME
jgi:hypothetical protein